MFAEIDLLLLGLTWKECYENPLDSRSSRDIESDVKSIQN